jgi:hypothetical protein
MAQNVNLIKSAAGRSSAPELKLYGVSFRKTQTLKALN